MNLPEALHTAARRYCIDQHVYWTGRYTELARHGKDRRKEDRGKYTDEALATFPRYNVLKAILDDIERLEPTQVSGLDETKETLRLAGLTASDEFTREPIGGIDALAWQEEREAFCQFIHDLSESQLKAVLPLPYRRVLSSDESTRTWARLRERWGITGGYWYPLASRSCQDIEAFQDRPFYEAVSADALRKLLRKHGIERVWELREYGSEHEEDLDWFEPYYNGAEGYWSSGQMDWIIYASHESSVTIGGWVLDEIKASWPSWQQRIWASPLF